MADELKGKKILLVDDDPDVVQTITAALADSGATIDSASDGNAALVKFAAMSPDLMVLDMMLPKRSGFLILERLKKGKKKTDPPRIIMITGNTGMRHRTYAESLGVDLYMNKPFRMDRLLEAINKILVG